MTAKELEDKIDLLYDEAILKMNEEPTMVCVSIQYKDEEGPFEDNVSLLDCIPDGYDDSDIFYYTSGIEDLKSLCHQDGVEDFYIVDVHKFFN